MNEKLMKSAAIKADEFLDALENAYGSLSEDEKDKMRDMVSAPIGLRDTDRFNLVINMATRKEVQDARRDLTSAISADKWAEGFSAAIQLMMLMGG